MKTQKKPVRSFMGYIVITKDGYPCRKFGGRLGPENQMLGASVFSTERQALTAISKIGEEPGMTVMALFRGLSTVVPKSLAEAEQKRIAADLGYGQRAVNRLARGSRDRSA